MQYKDVFVNIRYLVKRLVLASATAGSVAACAVEVERGEPPQRDPIANADGAGAPAVGTAAGASPVAHAPHFDPASARLPALPALPALLPSSAEDTGRYNQRKPKEVISHPAPLPPAAVDPQLSQRQHAYLVRWRDQEAAMRGASPDAVDRARAELKAKVVGE